MKQTNFSLRTLEDEFNSVYIIKNMELCPYLYIPNYGYPYIKILKDFYRYELISILAVIMSIEFDQIENLDDTTLYNMLHFYIGKLDRVIINEICQSLTVNEAKKLIDIHFVKFIQPYELSKSISVSDHPIQILEDKFNIMYMIENTELEYSYLYIPNNGCPYIKMLKNFYRYELINILANIISIDSDQIKNIDYTSLYNLLRFVIGKNNHVIINEVWQTLTVNKAKNLINYHSIKFIQTSEDKLDLIYLFENTNDQLMYLYIPNKGNPYIRKLNEFNYLELLGIAGIISNDTIHNDKLAKEDVALYIYECIGRYNRNIFYNSLNISLTVETAKQLIIDENIILKIKNTF